VYVFGLVRHTRELLESFLLLKSHGHVPTTFLVARALLEVAGQGAHVLDETRASIARKELTAAWDLLEAATIGRSPQRKGAATSQTSWPSAIHAQEDVRALAEWLPGETRRERERVATEMYDHLCEYCHPNIGAFSQYFRYEDRADGIFVFSLPSPSDEPPDEEMVIATGTALTVAEMLLTIHADHPSIVAALRGARDSLLAEAPSI
jgi:hypothetical protein